MIDARGWDAARDEKNLRVIERKYKLANVDGAGKKLHTNVFFNTCNYDTYILDIEDYLIVQTCNNHNWWDILDEAHTMRGDDLPRHIQDDIWDPDDTWRDEIYGLENKHEWYSLATGLIGTQIDSWRNGYENRDDYYCNSCWQEVWDVDGEIKCPCCGKNQQEIIAENKRLKEENEKRNQ
jgi:hypothetical protein